jgi:uncharacterized protein YggL (DUF469 family)
MQTILENKNVAKIFWISCFLILIVIGLTNYFWIGDISQNPSWLKTFSSGILESLAAAFITTLLIGGFIYYVAPTFDPKKGASFLGSHEFNDHFIENLKATNEWNFRGGFGRYLRTKILPTLNDIASNDRTPITIKAQILNPKNIKLCQLHADLRNSVANIDKKKDWSANDVKENLYSTIIACAIFKRNNSFMDVSVYLNDFFSTDRIDICSNFGLITKEDRKIPGLKFGKGSVHYNAYKGDLSVTQQQSNVVGDLTIIYTIGQLTPENIKSILKELSFDEEKYENDFYKNIAGLINKGMNPYA